jgi:AraC family ethanolamine operon transcriptional activator
MQNLSQPLVVGFPYKANMFQTLDADEHAACLREWGQCYDQLSAGRFSGCFEEFVFNRVQLFRERANQAIHESGAPWVGSRTLAVPVEVEGSGRFCGQALDIDSIITLKGGESLDFRTPRVHEILAITTDAAALGDYALQVEHRDIEAELTPRGVIPATRDQVHALRTFLATVMASLRATPAMLEHATIRKALEHAVYGAILEAVSTGTDNRPAPSGRTRQIVVERAREYMCEHIEEPISVADLCVQLRVSRRTLQYSFQDVLDLNPVKFLRALRLNCVRRELKRADPEHDTVADIAARWGFWHLSHFASDYRTMFDELPSETLRRRSVVHGLG